MGKNIWQNFTKPFFILAPMEDVTDTVFRRVVSSVGRPDLYFSEFTSCEGLLSVGQDHVIHRLKFEKEEKPIIAQIWGIEPENFYKASQIISKLGFDGIDINMGCPVKSVIKQGACSALIKNPKQASEIISAVKEGGKLPVSVKTRIGFNTILTDDWIGFLLSQNLDALTLHARTVRELSKPPAHWEEIKKAVEIKNGMNVPTKIIGNGDINSYEEGLKRIEEAGCDGVMIGRGIFHDPWIFNPSLKKEEITVAMRMSLLEHHIALFEKTWKEKKKYQVLKKYFKIYVSEFEGSADLRKRLMETNSSKEAFKIIHTS